MLKTKSIFLVHTMHKNYFQKKLLLSSFLAIKIHLKLSNECLNSIYLHLLRLHISTSCSNIYIQETGFGSCPTNLFPNSMFGLFVLDIISYTSLYCAWKDGTTSYCITGDIQYLPKWGVKYCYTVYIFITRL